MFKRRSNQNYYSNRGNDLRSRRALANKLHIVKDILIKLCIIFLLAGMIYVIMFSPVFAVKDVTIEGNRVVNTGEIDEIIRFFVSQKKWKFFTINLLLVDPLELENIIKNRFGSIDSVKIEKEFPKTIRVIIREKPADISWCNKIRVEKFTGEKNIPNDELSAYEIPQCYLSDENGLVYEKVGDNVSGDSVKVFRDEPIKTGDKISDDNLKNFIRKIFHNFNGKTGLSLAYLYILPPAERELHLITTENLKIYFDLNRDADEQISDLSAFIKNELKVNGNKSLDYEYIDMRVIDRINVKPKNETKQ